MSDGITDAWRQSRLSEEEQIRIELKHLTNWHSDLGKAINMLSDRLDELSKNKEKMESKNPILDSQVEELKNEREYSISRWENETSEEIQGFDDKHTQNDWIAYITKYSSRNKGEQEAWRKDMIKVANIALAAVSAFDRKGGVETVL